MSIRDAASVIVLRKTANPEDEVEVLLVQRRSTMAFMGGAFVFPGGAKDESDMSLEACAVRELREEAGVALAEESLVPFSHWVTPSFEKKRFNAHFFIASVPAETAVSIDENEIAEAQWVRPSEALLHSAKFALPPPQIHTLTELARWKTSQQILVHTKEMTAKPFTILPRLLPGDNAICLLLPWDPQYATHGTGNAHPVDATHPRAAGPSRFVKANVAQSPWILSNPPE